MVFVNFAGLNVKDLSALRKQCREQNVGYLVTKKTLMQLAFKEAKLDGFNSKNLPGSVASVFANDDELAASRVVGAFAKTHEALRPVGGMLEQRFIDAAMVMALSKLPSKQELLAKMVGSMQSPISGLVNVMTGNLRGLVSVLQAVGKSKLA